MCVRVRERPSSLSCNYNDDNGGDEDDGDIFCKGHGSRFFWRTESLRSLNIFCKRMKFYSELLLHTFLLYRQEALNGFLKKCRVNLQKKTKNNSLAHLE